MGAQGNLLIIFYVIVLYSFIDGMLMIFIIPRMRTRFYSLMEMNLIHLIPMRIPLARGLWDIWKRHMNMEISYGGLLHSRIPGFHL